MPATHGPALRLVKKHSRAIRWMHWINFPVLFVMIWSGLLIYWGDSIPPYQHPHQVYRIGLGHWTLFRFFPDWFWKLLNAPYRITTGLGWHFLFMWIFAINGIAYAAYLGVSGEWRVLWPEKRSLRDAIQVTLVDLHLRRGLPPQGKYNGAQRIAYSAIVLMGAGSLLTGLAIYKPSQAHWLTTLLGGYEMARWEHFWLTIGFCAFFLVHVGQVALAGWNNFRSMVSGYEIQARSDDLQARSGGQPTDAESGEPTGAAGEGTGAAGEETEAAGEEAGAAGEEAGAAGEEAGAAHE